MDESREICNQNIEKFLNDQHNEGSEMYKFEFKNLVLAGGGAKGVAYCGVARALERHGILNDIDRFAGTSAGAIAAALLCLGFNSYDIEHIMRVNMEKILMNDSDLSNFRGILQNATNILFQYGLVADNKFEKFLGMIFGMKNIAEDINFYQVYHQLKKELCIVVTNANTMSEEYCHVKTTPYMPIRTAVRMSMSIPGIFTPVKYKMFGKESFYIDGGLVCNYPIHCFDGWYLSMDNYIPAEIEMFKNPFKTKEVNKKTLGCVVYSEGAYHPFKDELENNCSVERRNPDTQLAREWERTQKAKDQHPTFYSDCKRAQENFLSIFEDNREYTRDEFQQILNEVWRREEQGEEIGSAHQAKAFLKMLTGEELNVGMIFSAMNTANNQTVRKVDLSKFSEEILSLLIHKYRELSHKRKEISGILDYMASLFLGLSSAVMKLFFKEEDVVRTVGINTGYIEMQNFSMDAKDKQFLLDQGLRTTQKFLGNFAKQNKLERVTQRRQMNDQSSLTNEQIERIMNYSIQHD